MSQDVGSPSLREVSHPEHPGQLGVCTALLTCGVLAAVMYVVADILAGVRTPGYSFVEQTISELAAVGAPTRGLGVALWEAHNALLAAFAVGLWMVARRPGLRVTAALLLAVAAIGAVSTVMFPMNPRGAARGVSDIGHVTSITANAFLIMTAMGFAAAALGRRFGLYALATIAVMLALGTWSMSEAGHVAAGLPTPWTGIRERVSVYAYLLWLAVLASTLLRRQRAVSVGRLRPSAGKRNGPQ